MDCIFCKIVKGELPSYKIYEDEKILAFLDVNPCSVGHTLIIPKKHTLDLSTIETDTLNHIMLHAKDISLTLADKLGADGFTLVQNNGFVQEVKHFHLHIIPKYENKCNMNFKEKCNTSIKSICKVDVRDVYEKITS